MNEKFSTSEKELIENFVKTLKDDLNKPGLDFKYDLLEHGNYIGLEYDIPRGNAASEKWSDRMLSDKFKVSDAAFYKIILLDKNIGRIEFVKYFCSKFLGENISTLNITDSFKGDFFHLDEFHAGIGIKLDWTNSKKIHQFFNDKRNYLLKVIDKNT